MNETSDLLTEVQDLVWAMIDEQASEEDIHRLERLLIDNDEARRTYVTCMQMHADLHLLFGHKPRLPEVLQKALAAEKAKPSKAPLPALNLPSGGSTVPLNTGCM